MKFRFALLLLVFPAACVPPDSSAVGESQSAIIGGTNDGADPGVVLVLNMMGQSGAICTGEVVSPHVVLTAAHCVDPSIGGTGGKYSIFTGTDLSAGVPTQFLAVKETHFNPAFNANAVADGNDVGVVVTTLPMAIASLPMNRMPLNASMVGKPVRLVGYGVTSGTDTMGTSAGVKRQTMTQFGGVAGTPVANLVQLSDPNHNTCEGDSGGPALMKLDGKTEVIVGVTSFGDQGCTRGGFDTRIDLFADSFVQPIIDKFDPPLPPDMSGPTGGGMMGFAPGTVGADCTDSSKCQSGVCASQGDTMFCTVACDPAAADSCPMGTHCGKVGSDNFCLRDARSGGCSTTVGGGAGSFGGALVLLLALFGLALRRSIRQ